MTDPSKLLVPAIVIVSILATLGSAWLGWRAHADARALHEQITEIGSETEQLLAGDEDGLVIDAALATWSDLVAGLHGAAASSGLPEFSYEMGDVVALAAPSASLAEGRPFAIEAEEDDLEEDMDEEGVADPSELPYRALVADVRGAGDFESIVTLAGHLAAAQPPLGVDELTITEDGPRPSFEARVYLVTALPVEPQP